MNSVGFEKLTNIRAFRFVVVTLLEAIALVVLSLLLPGIEIDTLATAIIVVFVVALVNALIWPLLSYIALPLTVYTLGLGTLFINALIIIIVTELVDGIYVENFFSAVGIAFALTLGNMAATHILSFDDDEVYYQNVLKKRTYKKFEKISDKPGIIFLEIDGLSAPTIKKAIKKGFMPNLKKWLKKTHELAEWETDLSSQTGASQAGILHGSNKNIPAFRWVEKKLDSRIITSTGKDDAPEIESRHSNGRGLLAKEGGSRTNLFSGDAEDTLFTFSQLSGIKKVYNKSLYAFFSNPYNFTRSFMLTIWDAIQEIRSRKRQERKNVIPRLGKEKRGGVYPLVRAAATVLLRDITAHAIIGDVYAGQKNTIYATFSGYDEVAHHSGVEDIDAFYVLRHLDKTFARIKKYADDSRRKYEFVVLSDHGQSKGSTFKQRYGYTLEGLITGLINPNSKVASKLETSEGWGSLNLMLSSITQDKDALSGKALRSVVRKNMYGDSVVMGPDHEDRQKDKEMKRADIIVLASGNLGLLYFPKWKRRLTQEQIDTYFPTLILGLVQHDGIGFVMVKSKKFGQVAIGRKGVYRLETGKTEGVNPLKDFGKNAPKHLLRESGYFNAPDILINSFYDPKKDEGAAFEELIGFHGGLGGNQARPFIMHPKELKMPRDKIIGSENLHKILKNWVETVK